MKTSNRTKTSKHNGNNPKLIVKSESLDNMVGANYNVENRIVNRNVT